jgi:hypothetical protein
MARRHSLATTKPKSYFNKNFGAYETVNASTGPVKLAGNPPDAGVIVAAL